MKNESRILIGVFENDIFIKPIGHITANQCFVLRENFYNRIRDIDPSYNIYIDMSMIDYMDSTFLGLLIGFEKKLFKNFKKHLYVINPNDSANKYLKCFTLTLFLKVIEKQIPDTITFHNYDRESSMSDLEKMELILYSHEDLSSISEENKKKFENLQKHLKNKIQKDMNKC